METRGGSVTRVNDVTPVHVETTSPVGKALGARWYRWPARNR
jgi:hypothetical protein